MGLGQEILTKKKQVSQETLIKTHLLHKQPEIRGNKSWQETQLYCSFSSWLPLQY
jgi:hypothetical protein